jgi:hypothetical protein
MMTIIPLYTYAYTMNPSEMAKRWLSWVRSNDKAIIDVLAEQAENLVKATSTNIFLTQSISAQGTPSAAPPPPSSGTPTASNATSADATSGNATSGNATSGNATNTQKQN